MKTGDIIKIPKKYHADIQGFYSKAEALICSSEETRMAMWDFIHDILPIDAKNYVLTINQSTCEILVRSKLDDWENFRMDKDSRLDGE